VAVAALVVIGAIGSATRGRTASPLASPGTVKLPLTPARAAAEHRRVDFGPGCDLTTGRLRVPSVYSPPCVPVFHGDNGGTTSPGVTATTITVAVYQAAPDLLQEATLATGASPDLPGQNAQTLRDYVDYFQAHYQTYGRTVRLVNVDASGGASDDAAAKADAIRVATEVKAFASFGGPTQTDAYAQELAARHVLCIGCATGATDAAVRAEAPFVWGIQPSPEQQNVLTAEYIGKQLRGGNASFAGPALRSRPRVFGLVAYDTPTGSFGPVRDDLLRHLAGYGVSVATTATYTLDISQAQEIARTLVTRLKGAGVTTVILDTDPFAPLFLTKEATSQGWFPEWVVTGSVLTDTAAIARLYPPDQWVHAFGLSELPGRVNELHSDPFAVHMWQFGTKPPAEGNYPLIYPNPLMLFTGIHLAGPDLTPASFRDAMWSFPVTGGGPTTARLSFGRHGFWPLDDYLGFDDATEIWWDPTANGPDEIGRKGTGLYRYADHGRRYLPGGFPSTAAHPFDQVGSVSIFDPPPDAPPCYPSPVGSRSTVCS
jgi:hypothetical protein